MLHRTLKLSLNVLLQHKLQNLLALLSVAIGIAVLLVMLSISQGAEQSIVERIAQSGANVLVVSAGRQTTFVGRREQSRLATTLRAGDCEAILREIPQVNSAAPHQEMNRKVKFGTLTISSTIIGTLPPYFTIRNYRLAQGHLFSDDDNAGLRRVAVIGHQVRELLFKDSEALDESILIGSVPFRVIGVLEQKGLTAEGANQDNIIIVPLRATMRRLFNRSYLESIYVELDSSDVMSDAEHHIRSILRERHGLYSVHKQDDFYISNNVKALEAQLQAARSFGLMTTGVSACAMIVGIAGLLAVMLLAVKARSGEIGLRIAVGARSRDIVLQFMIESLLLGLAGGLLGIGCGLIASYILPLVTAWKPAISWFPTGIAAAVDLLSALFVGVLTARKAARLQPTDALKIE